MEFLITLDDLAVLAGLASVVITGIGFIVRYFYQKFVAHVDAVKASLCKDIQDTKGELVKTNAELKVQSTTFANHLLESKGAVATLEFLEKLVVAGHTGAPIKTTPRLPPGQQKL